MALNRAFKVLRFWKRASSTQSPSRDPTRLKQRSFSPDQFHWGDLYHWLLVLNWWSFLGLMVGLYLVGNVFFAIAYLLDPTGINNAEPGSFWDAFFFSVQTMSTVGYGAMSPQSFYANVLVTVETLAGLLALAVITGLMFARFSQPTARVLFSHVAVICPLNGVPTLMFRVANQRGNQILEAQAQVSLVQREKTQEGATIRRFYDLPLLRTKTPIFALTWTVMHPIDPSSPLFGVTPETIGQIESGAIVVILTGLDETVSQIVHARHTYRISEVRVGHRFVDILLEDHLGRLAIDYPHFHDTLPVPSHSGDALK